MSAVTVWVVRQPTHPMVMAVRQPTHPDTCSHVSGEG
jgi:hypothetical protein